MAVRLLSQFTAIGEEMIAVNQPFTTTKFWLEIFQ